MAPTVRQRLRNVRDTSVGRVLVRAALRGSRVHCPCCDSTLRKFRGFNGPGLTAEFGPEPLIFTRPTES